MARLIDKQQDDDHLQIAPHGATGSPDAAEAGALASAAHAAADV